MIVRIMPDGRVVKIKSVRPNEEGLFLEENAQSGFKKVETLPASRYQFYKLDDNGEIVVDTERELSQLKIDKKQEIDSMYQKAIQEPIVFNEHPFQADHDSQDILSKVIVSAYDGFEVDWLDAQNNPVHMTLDDLRRLAQAILARGQNLFAEKVLLKRKIDGATAIEEVEAIASNAFQ